jgi:predicted methyltransferase
MEFNRIWAMPNSNTFDIKSINTFIERYNSGAIMSIDPFANKNRIAKITNDIDPSMNCNYNLDAIDFLKKFGDNSIDLVLFDPPYSPRQVSECYRKMGKTVNKSTTQSSFWASLKDEIARIIKPGGYCLSFAWSSNGIGKKRGFELQEILLVAHGGQHNDTICTAEIKI